MKQYVICATELKMILMLPICVSDSQAAIMAREIVIKNSVECKTKTKKKPTMDTIIPNTVGI